MCSSVTVFCLDSDTRMSCCFALIAGKHDDFFRRTALTRQQPPHQPAAHGTRAARDQHCLALEIHPTLLGCGPAPAGDDPRRRFLDACSDIRPERRPESGRSQEDPGGFPHATTRRAGEDASLRGKLCKKSARFSSARPPARHRPVPAPSPARPVAWNQRPPENGSNPGCGRSKARHRDGWRQASSKRPATGTSRSCLAMGAAETL